MRILDLLAIDDDKEFTATVHKHSVDIIKCILDILLEPGIEQLKLDDRIVEMISAGAYDTLQSVIAKRGNDKRAVYECIEGIVTSSYMVGQLSVDNLVEIYERNFNETV